VAAGKKSCAIGSVAAIERYPFYGFLRRMSMDRASKNSGCDSRRRVAAHNPTPVTTAIITTKSGAAGDHPYQVMTQKDGTTAAIASKALRL
jgi:hypothetical protein